MGWNHTTMSSNSNSRSAETSTSSDRNGGGDLNSQGEKQAVKTPMEPDGTLPGGTSSDEEEEDDFRNGVQHL